MQEAACATSYGPCVSRKQPVTREVERGKTKSGEEEEQPTSPALGRFRLVVAALPADSCRTLRPLAFGAAAAAAAPPVAGRAGRSRHLCCGGLQEAKWVCQREEPLQ